METTKKGARRRGRDFMEREGKKGSLQNENYRGSTQGICAAPLHKVLIRQ